MKKIIKRFEELTTSELYEILRVRAAVFVVEQECIYQDLDGLDQESWHVFLQDQEGLQAYLRFFMKKDEKRTVQIGRVLTMQRSIGLGERILKESVSFIKENIPEILPAAKSRLFSCCFQILSETEKLPENMELINKIYKIIKELNIDILKDSNGKPRNRCAALISIISISSLHKLLRIYYKKKLKKM